MDMDYEDVRTNIPLLDRQHARYFDAVEKLLAHCGRPEPDPAALATILRETQDYAIDNFDTEEYMMDLSHYDEKDVHAGKHAFFKDRVDGLFQMLEQEDADAGELAEHLRALLVGWFATQIRHDDMRLAAFLHARGKAR